jgi:hypothetical protein
MIRMMNDQPAVTVQIVTGAGWYRRLVGSRFEVISRDGRFILVDYPSLTIDKNHAIVAEIKYSQFDTFMEME